MKIDAVTPSLSKNAGGLPPAIINLYSNLVTLHPDNKVTILTLLGGDFSNYDTEFLKIEKFCRSHPKKIGASKELFARARKTDADLIHAHGLWMMPTRYQNIAHSVNSIPYIISPHGMLDPWILSRGRIKKLIARMMYENYSWKHCSVFHALNKTEADAIKNILPAANVEIIPNGITLAPYKEKTNDQLQLLFLGRFHEKKNLHSLVNAINSISENDYSRNPFTLNVVGWGDDQYIRKIKALIMHGSAERFNWIGPAFDDDKAKILEKTDAFILPSFSEGLPVAVLEAWANGLVVLKSKYCNMPEAFENNVAIDTGTDVDSIKRSIITFLNLSEFERKQISKAGHDYVSSRYSWSKICSEFNLLYKEVVRKG